MSLTDEERAARKIGGSTIAKILKKSRWGTPLDAYLELTGQRTEEKTGEDIDRGNFLEPALREWASKKTGMRFEKPPMHTFPEWDWATVSPDGLTSPRVDPGSRLLEIKAPRRADITQWGEEGSDEVPVDALCQTHWGLMCTNAGEGIVASLLGGELKIFRVTRDRDLEKKMLDAAKSFVEGYVIPRIPPPAQWGDDANILYMHPRNTAPNRDWSGLSEQEKYVVGEYLQKYAFESEALKALEGWEPVIKNVIGDASGINLPAEYGKRIDWKSNATAGTKWKQLAESLLVKLPAEEVEQLKAQFAGTPTRALRPWLNASKEK